MFCNINRKVVQYTRRINSLYSFKSCNIIPVLPKRNYSDIVYKQKGPIDINTNTIKDVILYKYESPRTFKMLNFFALTQYLFWVYLGYFSYTSMKDAPVDKSKLTESAKWYEKVNLGENKYKNTLAVLSMSLGFGILAISWGYTLRSVRYLILHKGGKDVSFVTYTPFGENRIMKVDLKHVSCQTTRSNATAQLPIKVKNTFMYYMLDMRGEFRNPKLFDFTAGLKRVL